MQGSNPGADGMGPKLSKKLCDKKVFYWVQMWCSRASLGKISPPAEDQMCRHSWEMRMWELQPFSDSKNEVQSKSNGVLSFWKHILWCWDQTTATSKKFPNKLGWVDTNPGFLLVYTWKDARQQAKAYIFPLTNYHRLTMEKWWSCPR